MFGDRVRFWEEGQAKKFSALPHKIFSFFFFFNELVMIYLNCLQNSQFLNIIDKRKLPLSNKLLHLVYEISPQISVTFLNI